jgi:hypothetical protein
MGYQQACRRNRQGGVNLAAPPLNQPDSAADED